MILSNAITAADVWAAVTRTLTDPDSYKADVSALALEATVAALNDLAQSDILSDATPFAGADIATILSEIQNGTYGLSALEVLVDDLETKSDRKVSCMTFWSDVDDEILLPSSVADTNLPDVVVAGLPAGVTLVRAVVILIVRAIENTSATGANAIDGAQAIRVMKSGGSWGSDDVAAINLADNMWIVAASTREFGDVIVGDNDVKGEVDENATYNLRFEDALVDYTNLKLNDIKVGIRIWFY